MHKTMGSSTLQATGPGAGMPRRAILGLALAPLGTLALPALAQAQGKPKEHPVVRFYPGAEVSDYQETKFDAANVVTGVKKEAPQEPVIESLEGRIIRYKQQHQPGSSPLQVLRNFQTALTGAGLTTLATLQGGQAEYHEFEGIVSKARLGAFRLDVQGRPALHVNVMAATDGEITWSNVLIVESRALEQVYVAGSGELFDALQKSGRVSVHGIQFETGKATILAESEKVLAQMHQLLEQHATLKLRIVGHTDNAGGKAHNDKLSAERASAVKAWLVRKGVAASRLETAGMGATVPVAANDSEAGRAKNRRVELIRLP